MCEQPELPATVEMTLLETFFTMQFPYSVQ